MSSNKSENNIACSQCGSHEYTLLNPKTGEVMCTYCRSRWFVAELIEKTETEKYLEEMAKRPQVTIDNSTETDQKLMEMVSGLASGLNPLAALGNVLKRVLVVVGIVILVVLIAVAFLALRPLLF